MQSWKFGLLYLVVFSLPMYMRVNNILLGIFISWAVLDNIINGRYSGIRTMFLRGLPILVFFFLAIVGAFRSFSLENLSYLEKYWSFLLLPIALLPDLEACAVRKRSLFIALTWGCLATLLICYTNVVWEIISREEPASYFFRWRHIGHQFTEIADTHPTYLAMFIVTSICFLAQDRKSSYTMKSIVIPILILSLYQLASRMALIILALLLIFIIVQWLRKNKWQLAAVLFGLVFGGLLVFYYGSDYLKQRYFSKESIMNDRRIARWEVSYDIFKEYPVWGVGFKEIKPLRKEGYLTYGFTHAASEDFNAHNQFLEYLSTQGVVGGFVYGVSMMYLFLLAVYQRDLLFAFIFFAIIVANLSESMLVRIKGIEYLALFGTLFICSIYSVRKEDEVQP
ncbi:MAG: O-antigen ligase family protein [Maribacter sp.]|nr:O-antigen ligase family protein [Maribacter sp.]